ncbi:uncharacterized protein BXZ73DRAFT_54189 [Epithele typhae]|uniref:uncharacterized protein n=1 Tax=Epithele typhae TaxID=378194 RepID=UPI0020082821|nr:uncharacterized protein BXZ73DRAFT_54189 [Epithele typhae]KAH9915550.1 hypothetical protein BXZ73DRAFT_54189 [Epithele typhae]
MSGTSCRLRPLSALLGFHIVAALVICGRGHPAAYELPPLAPSLYARQDPASSINWWPFPAYSQWNKPTDAAIPSSLVGPTDVAVGTQPSQTASTTSLSAGPSPTTGVSTTTPSAPSSTTSATSASSIVHIAALPPASQQSSVTRHRNQVLADSPKDFNFAFLSPVFAILGVGVGIGVTMLLYRVLGGSLTPQGSHLRSGSAYTSSALSPHGYPATPRRSSLVPPDLTPRPNSALLVPKETPGDAKEESSWLMRALSTVSRTSTATGAPARDAEQDPFLADPTAVCEVARVDTQRRIAPGSRSMSSDQHDYGEEDDVLAQAPPRHKSIRRSILERLRLGTIRRPRFQSYPEEGDDEEYLERRRTMRSWSASHRRRENSGPWDDGSPIRRPSHMQERRDLLASPPGFRILLEDPESGFLQEEDGSPAVLPSRAATIITSKQEPPSQSSDSDGAHIPRPPSDRFTPKPKRRTAEDKRNSPFTPPSKATLASAPQSPRVSRPLSERPPPSYHSLVAPAHAPVPDSAHIDILPFNPPLIASPPLQTSLLFGPAPELSLRHFPASPPYPRASNDDTPKARGKGKQKKDKDKRPDKHADRPPRNKLHTAREPPPLPFPSSPQFHTRLTKAHLPPSAAAAAASSSGATLLVPSAAVARGTPAQRHLARKTALGKVDEIVARSYGGGSPVPMSPNNYGKIVGDAWGRVRVRVRKMR